MNTLWLIVDVAGHAIARSIRRGAALVGCTGLTLAFSILLTGTDTPSFLMDILCVLAAGALIGILIAGTAGGVQGMVTGLFFQTRFKPKHYHDVLSRVTALSAALLGVAVFLVYCGTAGPVNPIYVCFGAIVAILSAVYGLGDVPTWYLNRKRKIAEQTDAAGGA